MAGGSSKRRGHRILLDPCGGVSPSSRPRPRPGTSRRPIGVRRYPHRRSLDPPSAGRFPCRPTSSPAGTVDPAPRSARPSATSGLACRRAAARVPGPTCGRCCHGWRCAAARRSPRPPAAAVPADAGAVRADAAGGCGCGAG
jgi:hypothetical protein